MLYYTVDSNNKIINYCNNKKLGDLLVKNGEWANVYETEEEIVQQGDGSGLVFASAYVAPEAEGEIPTVEEQLSEIQDVLLTIMELNS